MSIDDKIAELKSKLPGVEVSKMPGGLILFKTVYKGRVKEITLEPKTFLRKSWNIFCLIKRFAR